MGAPAPQPHYRRRGAGAGGMVRPRPTPSFHSSFRRHHQHQHHRPSRDATKRRNAYFRALRLRRKAQQARTPASCASPITPIRFTPAAEDSMLTPSMFSLPSTIDFFGSFTAPTNMMLEEDDEYKTWAAQFSSDSTSTTPAPSDCDSDIGDSSGP